MNNMICIDFDDCLVSDDCVPNPVDLAYLQKYALLSNVGKLPSLRLCTGRNMASSSIFFNLVGRPTIPGFSIFEGGSVLYCPATGRQLINPQIKRLSLRQLKAVRDKIAGKITALYPQVRIVQGNMVNVAFRRIRQSSLSLEALLEIVKKHFADWAKGHMTWLNVLRVKKKKRTKKEFTSAVNIVVYGKDVAVLPRGIDKGRALSYVAAKENINFQACLGIGNDATDISFLRKVGLPACVANASQDCRDYVKKRAGMRSAHPCLSGVVDIIQQYSRFEPEMALPEYVI